jgi:hypothetical protein
MKGPVLLVALLFCAGVAFCQADTVPAEKPYSVLTRVQAGRYSGLPVLEVFHLPSEGFTFRVDSSIMTRDINSLLGQVQYLDSLENLHRDTSSYLTAKQLMHRTGEFIVQHANPGSGWVDVGKALDLALKLKIDPVLVNGLYDQMSTGRKMGNRRAEGREVNLGQEEVKNGGKGGGPKPPKPKGIAGKGTGDPGIAGNGGNPNGAPSGYGSGPGPAKTNVPILNILNNSTKNLYVYVEEEYKGILYPGKIFQLKGLMGCYEIIAESLDQFRSSKKHCFSSPKVNEWLIKN